MKNNITYPTIKDIIEIHNNIIENNGGLFGINNKGLSAFNSFAINFKTRIEPSFLPDSIT